LIVFAFAQASPQRLIRTSRLSDPRSARVRRDATRSPHRRSLLAGLSQTGAVGLALWGVTLLMLVLKVSPAEASYLSRPGLQLLRCVVSACRLRLSIHRHRNARPNHRGTRRRARGCGIQQGSSAIGTSSGGAGGGEIRRARRSRHDGNEQQAFAMLAGSACRTLSAVVSVAASEHKSAGRSK
jgi:uncharacterized membrane protein YgcG